MRLVLKKNLSHQFIFLSLLMVICGTSFIKFVVPRKVDQESTIMNKAQADQKKRKSSAYVNKVKISKSKLAKSSSELKFPKVNINDWNLVLVNSDHKFTVPVNLELIEGSFSVDRRIVEPTLKMFADARAQGFNIQIISSFRTEAEQQAILNQKIAQFESLGEDENSAQKHALARIARPNFSEHHTGLALDIIDGNFSSNLTEFVENTPGLQWLKQNCYHYGFILRYPKGKEKITKYIYEPWHFRYVGKKGAKYIFDHDLTLEEFHELWRKRAKK
jgi:D-alanyl-D-alanine carboxypeptidase